MGFKCRKFMTSNVITIMVQYLLLPVAPLTNLFTVKLLLNTGSQINAGSLLNAGVSRPVFDIYLCFWYIPIDHFQKKCIHVQMISHGVV